ncbi:MAG: hypothetical protein OSB10_04250 [Planctomycetota bacterium]|nr:hypothetical protein [Planctomycetota bacterium]
MKVTFKAFHGEQGTALIATLMIVSTLALFGSALLTTTLSASRTLTHQVDEFQLSSAVDSVALLSMQNIWSDYVTKSGGAPGGITGFRTFLDDFGVEADEGSGPPSAEEGADFIPHAGLPDLELGSATVSLFDGVIIDAIQVVRRDIGETTQLYVTVSASTRRGRELTNPVINRAVQQVYTIEPESFEGFDYAILANNVNCIFCHSQVDTVGHFFNEDPDLFGTHERAKVGTLESLMLRHNMDGNSSAINDYDSDSVIGGTLAIRGAATDQDGLPIDDWGSVSMHAFDFDSEGIMAEDDWGNFLHASFTVAEHPVEAFENLYLDYPKDYADMVDGKLPTSFPAPISDDGGFSEALGGPVPEAVGNKIVDDVEFDTIASKADGAITAGVLTYIPDGYVVGDAATYSAALFVGNMPSIQQSVDSHVILSGTKDNPITIDGTVTIDGDAIINGYVKGEGTLLVRGNIYVPTDLQYLDGNEYLPGDSSGTPTGARTFGIAQDGTANALAISSGGNIVIGDYTKPASWFGPTKYDYITGDTDSDFNFTLGEIAIFNRAEWAKTLPMVPAQGEIDQDPSTWTVANPFFGGTDYAPRYYNYHEDDSIPIYNKGNLYFDPTSETWRGDAEVAAYWDFSKLSIADPLDPSDPYLYNLANGQDAVQQHISPEGGWITDWMYKLSIEYFEDTREYGEPMKIDGLVYTNNAVFTIVHRWGPMLGSMQLNGALVAADLGVLVPGYWNWGGIGTSANPPGSPFKVGLQLNYDPRVKNMLNVSNPNQVQIKRTLWNPTANIL